MTCATCAHSGVNTAPDKAMFRVCQRFPPAIGFVVMAHGITTVQGFPRVQDTLRCGEYRAPIGTASKLVI